MLLILAKVERVMFRAGREGLQDVLKMQIMSLCNENVHNVLHALQGRARAYSQYKLTKMPTR